MSIETVRRSTIVPWPRWRRTTTSAGDATVRREVGVAFGMTAVWPVTVFAVALMLWATVAQFGSVEREHHQVATRVAGAIDGMVDVSTRSMQAAAAAGDLARLSPDEMDALLDRLLHTRISVDELTFVSADGRQIGIASDAPNADATDAVVFQGAVDAAASAVESGEVAIGGGFHQGFAEYVYAIAVPTTTAGSEETTGALVGVAPLSALAKLLGDVNAETSGTSYVVTADGQLVANEDLDRVLAGTKLHSVSSGLTRGIDGTPVIAGAAPLTVGGGTVTVLSAESVVTAMAPAVLAIIPSALLMCLVFVARRVRDRLTRRIVEPIEALATSARQLAGGDLCTRADSSEIVEFDRLAADFNGMAARLQQTVSSLEDQTRRLVDSNQQLEVFASIAAHDLREPLRKIQFFGDRLDSVCGDGLNDAGRDCVTRMSSASRRMSELIESLLTYSKVSTTAAPFERVDLNETVAGVLGDLEAVIADRNAEITVTPLPVVKADPMQMRQLFQNLISNALKYHEPGTPAQVTISTDAAVPDAPGETGARVLVRDNGIGIDPEQHDQIFKVFSRLHGRSEYEGTGIGLAVCRRIVDRHDGCITVESQAGQGSTFIVSLPRALSLEHA